MILKILASGAVALGAAVGVAASASADPNIPFQPTICADSTGYCPQSTKVVGSLTLAPEQQAADIQAALSALQTQNQPN